MYALAMRSTVVEQKVANVTEGKEAGCVTVSVLFYSSQLGYGSPIRRYLCKALEVRKRFTMEYGGKIVNERWASVSEQQEGLNGLTHGGEQ